MECLHDFPFFSMLNSNGVKEIQGYAFNGSSLEEVYVILNYCSETKTKAQRDNTQDGTHYYFDYPQLGFLINDHFWPFTLLLISVLHSSGIFTGMWIWNK